MTNLGSPGPSHIAPDSPDRDVPGLTTLEFLTLLRELHVNIRLEGGRLLISAPPKILSAVLRGELERRKPQIIALLRGFDGRPTADGPEIQRIERNGEMQLSFAQARLWFLEQLSPGGAAYTILTAARIRGRLDHAVVERSLTEIVRRHETLRTCFPQTNGQPYLSIAPPSPLAVEVIDLHDFNGGDGEAHARAIATEVASQPFDLTNGPLFRTRLLRLREDDHILLITVHHTIFDEWSAGVFWSEFCSIYDAFRSGNPSPLPELPIQYADFAAWQRRCLEDPIRQAHLTYWKRQLEGCAPSLNLPPDFARSGLQHQQAEKHTIRLSRSVSESLAALAQQERTSLFMVLLAAFNVLCWRLTGQDDILVGTPIAGRSRAETEPLLGFFINTVVIRTRLAGAKSFTDLLADVRDTVLDAYDHQDMPFEEVVAEFAEHRDLTRTPLFQVFFNHLNVPVSPAQIPGLDVEIFGDTPESKFDLTLYSAEENGSIRLTVLYNVLLFGERRMEAFLDQYSKLLEQICADRSKPLESYTLLTSSSVGVLPDATAPLALTWPASVQDRFIEQASRAPERIAIVQGDLRWSYRRLEQFSGGLAEWLRRHGVVSGDIVAIYGSRCAQFVASILGVLRAGAAFCIVDPAYPATALANRIRAANPKAWLQIETEAELPDELAKAVEESTRGVQLRIPRSDRRIAKLGLPSEGYSVPDVNPDSKAYVTFTSGTTGSPKCIVGTHRPLSHFVSWHVDQFGLSANDRFSMLSSLAHDPLLRDIFAPLWLGATLCIPAEEDIFLPGRLLNWMSSNEITVAHLTPAMAALLAQSSDDSQQSLASVPSLRYVFFGGDVLTSRDVERVAEGAPNAKCINFYGATETPQAMAWHRVERVSDLPGPGTSSPIVQIPIGRPISDTQLLVLNKAGGLAGVGELGEIYIRTPYLTMGYINDEALTRTRFLTNPFTGAAGDRVYRTGDLGRYRPDGVVDFAGRADGQVKIRGYRIELGEIEAVIAARTSIQECAVIVRDDGSAGKRLAAFLVVRDPAQANPEELRKGLAGVLPEYMVPSSFTVLSTMPLTPNGKVDRRALALTKDASQTPSERYVPPSNHVERVMAGIWSDVLGVVNVSVDANFFHLGGHSLAAVRLMAKVQSGLGLELPLRCIFIDPTISGLSKHIRYDVATRKYRYMSEIPRWNCLVPAQPRGTRAPLYFVAGYMSADDTLLVLSRLIPHLGLDQPVFGLRPRWFEGANEGYSNVDEIVSDFLAELRTVQPKGPYLLGGHCVGGVVALEIARQLMQQGEEVRLLAMVDTERPSAMRAFLANMRLLSNRVKHIGDVISEAMRPRGRSRKALVLELVRRKHRSASWKRKEVTSKPSEVKSPDLLYQLRIGYRRLIYNHSLDNYPGRITLFINERQHAFDKDLGWDGVAEGGLIIHKLPGDHDTLLPIHGKELSKLLLTCIDEAMPEMRPKRS